MRITELHITNFRSLRKLDLTGLQQVNVFYGENNVGKSNVLAAIDLILRTKRPARSIEGVDVVFRNSLLQGELSHFDDNFWDNDKTAAITFKLGLTFTPKEIMTRLFKRVDPTKVQQLADSTLFLSGRISYLATAEMPDVSGDIAYFQTRDITWGDFPLYSSESTPDPFIPNKGPTLLGLGSADIKELCEQIGALASDSFQLVNSSRFIGQELSSPAAISIGPNNIKNVLLNWSQGVPDRNSIEVYHEVRRRFGEKPFNYGMINPWRQPSSPQSRTDLLVKTRDLWLPIDHLGTGAQQVLILLAHLASKRDRPLMGIEELELNLSPRTQDAVLQQLAQAAADPEFPLDQLFLTSHSGALAGDYSRVFMLQIKAGETIVVSPAESTAAYAEYQGPAHKECFWCPTWQLTDIAKGLNQEWGTPILSYFDWANVKADEAEVQKQRSQKYCTRCKSKTQTEARKLVADDRDTWPWPPAS